MKNEKHTIQEFGKIAKLLRLEKNDKQNLFQTLFTYNLTINLLLDKETSTIVKVNKAACDFYGYSEDEFVGMHLNQINILSENEIMQEISKIDINELYVFTFKHKLKNGEIRDVEVYSSQIEVENRQLLYSTIFDVTKQKKIELELNESKTTAIENEMYFKAICEQALDGINLADNDGNITFANQAYCQMLGYTEDEMLKMTVHELKADTEKSVFKETIEKDYTLSRTLKLKRKNNDIIYVDLSTKKIHTEKQELILGIVRDVTERVEKEKELHLALEKIRESEQQFKYIFNNLQDAYFEADISGRFVKINETAPKIYGYESEDEMMNMPALNLYANENDRSKIISLLSSQGKVIDFICKAKRKDETTFWVSMNVQFKYDSDGKIAGTVGVVRDISDRKAKDEQIKTSEENYRSIYDNAIEGMYRTSLKGKCLQSNNALANILGYKTAAEVIEIINDTENQVWVNPNDRLTYINLLEQKGILEGYECQFKRADGTIIWVSQNTKLVRDVNGEKLYFEGFIVDITDRKNKELEIQKKMKELQWHFDIAIERELKMVELKNEVNQLLLRLGSEKKYGI